MSHPPAGLTRIARLAALLALILPAAIASGLAVAPAEAAIGRATTVSLTFDDGNANQMSAATILKRYGLKGTFFINSGFVGAPGYLTDANLATLKANGQEIGGHSLSHPDLTNLPIDEVKRQVCNDRAALLGKGFAVRSFAYPFASVSPAVETAVKDCGYNSARALGDLGIPGDPECVGCPPAATLPPTDPYATEALPQVESTWKLSDLQGAVTRAERTGGWVQFTFHNVCAASAKCELNVTPTTLEQFALWLSLRGILRNTVVKTVGDTIGGAVAPAVTGPVATPAGPGVNGVVNPGMETLNSDGTPQCWMKGGYGANTAVLDLATPGRSGDRAGRVTMSGYTDGDAKWLPQFDLGGCSPSVAAGHTYSMRQWYTSTGVTQFAIYLRNSAGVWAYWTSSPWFAASPTFTQATWTTPEIPAGMTGISFGLNVFGNGTLTTDDSALYDSVGAPDPVTDPLPTPAVAPQVSKVAEPQATESDVAGG
ncbi:polysaccharide deacetylase family protein [Aeromicrobium sp. UC242_57]|uniref:polysaccharide deacetylase family protein n=1 Tax=Aeromicrobium sp. UC242_57 TaxID=3374624 RepID=UPI0037A8E4E3